MQSIWHTAPAGWSYMPRQTFVERFVPWLADHYVPRQTFVEPFVLQLADHTCHVKHSSRYLCSSVVWVHPNVCRSVGINIGQASRTRIPEQSPSCRRHREFHQLRHILLRPLSTYRDFRLAWKVSCPAAHQAREFIFCWREPRTYLSPHLWACGSCHLSGMNVQLANWRLDWRQCV